jgi:hypothetical protein
MGATHFSGLVIKPVATTEAAITLSEWEHSGKTLVLNLAATQAVTLPAATGSGSKFNLFVGITKTGDCTISVANADDTMAGAALIDGTTSTLFQTAATSDRITMDGSVKGGLLGSTVELEDVAANVWKVWMVGNGSGTEETPFSAAVS